MSSVDMNTHLFPMKSFLSLETAMYYSCYYTAQLQAIYRKFVDHNLKTFRFDIPDSQKQGEFCEMCRKKE